jgi:LmbE family N-acetylglucosaminyl deacetylase
MNRNIFKNKTECLRLLSDEHYSTAEQPPIVVVSAHADDEVIGLGGQISRLKNITFIHITDGAPENMKDALKYGFSSREQYTKKRYEEFCNALLSAGIKMPSYIKLGFADQKSSFDLVKITQILASIFMALKPGICITHPYEGGHPDHDSACFSVHAALKILRKKEIQVPIVFEFCSYHADSQGKMVTFDFLPYESSSISKVLLSPAREKQKIKMFDSFVTQKNVLQNFPSHIECFREAPEYDFLKPPHEGKLYYEYYDWGMQEELWRSLAEEALKRLFLE